MREAVRFIATRSAGFNAKLAARLAGGLAAIGRAIERAWRGGTAASRPAEPNRSALAGCRRVAEEINGASLQDRWSMCR